MRKISCLIVEDEPKAAQLIATYVSRVPELTLAGICYDALEALELLKRDKVDLLFLDINLPQMSGIDLAAVLGKEQKIIFTTAYAEYALESFEYFVIDYLLKPISFKRFLQAIEKLKILTPNEEDESKKASILLKSGREIIKLDENEILFIEGMKEYICVHTSTRKVMTYKRMKDIEQLLPNIFLRVHNSYIVNMTQVSKMLNNELMINGNIIPVSLSYKEKVSHYLQTQLL